MTAAAPFAYLTALLAVTASIVLIKAGYWPGLPRLYVGAAAAGAALLEMTGR